MTITINQSPWVAIRPGDPSYQLAGDVAVTNRAFIEIVDCCPRSYAEIIAKAIEQGWIQAVAAVPRNDPTLMWDLLRKKT